MHEKAALKSMRGKDGRGSEIDSIFWGIMNCCCRSQSYQPVYRTDEYAAHSIPLIHPHWVVVDGNSERPLSITVAQPLEAFRVERNLAYIAAAVDKSERSPSRRRLDLKYGIGSIRCVALEPSAISHFGAINGVVVKVTRQNRRRELQTAFGSQRPERWGNSLEPSFVRTMNPTSTVQQNGIEAKRLNAAGLILCEDFGSRRVVPIAEACETLDKAVTLPTVHTLFNLREENSLRSGLRLLHSLDRCLILGNESKRPLSLLVGPH